MRELRVVNKRFHTAGPNDYYVGRPSVLGNPFTHLKSDTKAKLVVETRQEAIELYRLHLLKEIDLGNDAIINELIKVAKSDTDTLVCWCWPKNCHAAFIATLVEAIRERNKFTKEDLQEIAKLWKR